MTEEQQKAWAAEFIELAKKHKVKAAYFIVVQPNIEQPRECKFLTGGHALACSLLDTAFRAGVDSIRDKGAKWLTH